jgi:hypothetical protein
VALINKDRVLDHAALDARNNEQRPKTFKEVVLELFNDLSFAATIEALATLHQDFSEEIDLPFEKMPGPITPEGVKMKMMAVQGQSL